MIDMNTFFRDAENACERLALRGVRIEADVVRHIVTQKKEGEQSLQRLSEQSNKLAKKIGFLKSSGEDAAQTIQEAIEVNRRLSNMKETLSETSRQLHSALGLSPEEIPNLPHTSVPIGKDESENLVIRSWGDPNMSAHVRQDHCEIGANLGGIDMNLASKISGSRFSVLRGNIATLHRALSQYMLDVQTKRHEYEECYVPYIVNKDSLYGTGQLPKFEDDLFCVDETGSQYLIPTAEVPLTNIVRDATLEQSDLPLRLTAHTPCFRSEAGSHGKDIKGLIRQHQFDKVEMVQIVDPERSYDALEEMVGHAEYILQSLGLPYRVVSLCTGDLGFSAAKTYDIEAWLPSQQKYREISSISNCEDFQARRLNARYKSDRAKKSKLVHTLNGSGLAVGRCLVAIIENYQNEDGSIFIPEVLRDRMDNQERINK